MATSSASSLKADAPEIIKPHSARRETWRRFARNRPALIGLVVLILLFLTAIFAPVIAPYDYAKNDLDNVEKPPSAQHWFGTDRLGRDMFSRMVYGARSVVFVIVVTTTITLILGLTMGSIAGYFGGIADMLISRLIDFLFAFPELLLIFFIAATIKPGIVNGLKAFGQANGMPWLVDLVRSGYVDYFVVICVLSLLGWIGLARMVRGQILSLREKEFVLGAEAVGVPQWRIMTRYLLPNSMAPILVGISLSLGALVISEGFLSFLGIGLQPPNASWGNIMAENAGRYWREWPEMLWMILIPFIVMATVIFAFNFVGDGLNEALNPEL